MSEAGIEQLWMELKKIFCRHSLKGGVTFYPVQHVILCTQQKLPKNILYMSQNVL